MKAIDIPKLLLFVDWQIDVMMAKVEFMCNIGIRYFVLCKMPKNLDR
jgi:hypothetical protein